MKTLIKTTIAATAAASMILGGMVAPSVASAAPQSYVCKAEKSNDAKTGMILGALIGGVIGNKAAKNERGLGTVAGAVVGGAIGNKLGKDHGKSTGNKIEEQARETYGYNSGYGYRTVYNSRTHRYEQVRYTQYQPVRYGYR